MTNEINAYVLGIRRGEVEGNKYASLYIVQEGDSSDPDIIGNLPLKVTCSHEIVDKAVREKFTFPGDYSLLVTLNMAAGGKAGMKVTDLRSVKGPVSSGSPASLNK